jgi:hypothetical protein
MIASDATAQRAAPCRLDHLSSSLLGGMFAYAENLPYGIADLVNTKLHGVVAGGLNGGILSSRSSSVLWFT